MLAYVHMNFTLDVTVLNEFSECVQQESIAFASFLNNIHERQFTQSMHIVYDESFLMSF